jgi:hypothetical protein
VSGAKARPDGGGGGWEQRDGQRCDEQTAGPLNDVVNLVRVSNGFVRVNEMIQKH